MDYKRVLILHFTNGMSGREIAETTGYKKTTVNEFLKRFRECEELSYPLSEDVTKATPHNSPSAPSLILSKEKKNCYSGIVTV